LAGVEGGSDIIRAEGAIIRQSLASKTFQRKIVLWLGKAVKNPAVGSSGVLAWQPSCEGQPSKLVPPSHEPLLLSKAASVGQWRFMEKWFSGRGFVAARDVRRCSGFARTATADRAIAVRLAARKLGAGNAALPTAAINGVWRAGSIIATGNVRTASVTRRLA
jgi:hypothetical protein